MRMATFKWIRPADLPMLRLCDGVSGRGAWAGQCVQTSPASKDKRGKDVDGRSRLLVGTNNILFLPSTGLPVRKDILRCEEFASCGRIYQ